MSPDSVAVAWVLMISTSPGSIRVRYMANVMNAAISSGSAGSAATEKSRKKATQNAARLFSPPQGNWGVCLHRILLAIPTVDPFGNRQDVLA